MAATSPVVAGPVLVMEIAAVDPEHTFTAAETARIIAAIHHTADALVVNVVHPNDEAPAAEDENPHK